MRMSGGHLLDSGWTESTPWFNRIPHPLPRKHQPQLWLVFFIAGAWIQTHLNAAVRRTAGADGPAVFLFGNCDTIYKSGVKLSEKWQKCTLLVLLTKSFEKYFVRWKRLEKMDKIWYHIMWEKTSCAGGIKAHFVFRGNNKSMSCMFHGLHDG